MAQSQHKLTKADLPCSPSHARALVAHLKTVEDFCGEVARLTETRDRIYTEYVGAISEGDQQKIRAVLAQVYEGIEEIRDRLGLRKQQTDRFNAINAYLSELWVSLVETKSSHLKAYGAVPESLAGFLDPRLDALEAQIRQLREIIERHKARRGADR